MSAQAAIDCSVWYRPEIGARLTPDTRFVFREWSGLSDEDLVAHLHRIRDQAWPLGKFPCIGLWMFLLPGIAGFPEFPSVLEIARRPHANIIDIGCGLGQDLRLLAAHGVPTERMWALDIEAHLWNLGFDLFRDRGRMHAGFIHADFQKTDLCDNSQLGALTGKVDLIMASQFLHLFDWDGQLAASKKIVGLSKLGTMLVGFQQGREQAREYIRPWGMMFYHNRESFLRLWDSIQEQTGTRWKIQVVAVPLQDWGMQDEDLTWMPEDRMGINFLLTREE